MRFFGSHNINKYVADYISRCGSYLSGKTVVDLPAGEGFSSNLLREQGAKVHPYDLFPEVFKVAGLECKKADLTQVLPVESDFADLVLCQEGIEHLPNQYFALCELNRITKNGGRMLLTTPNYSNMRSRFSYLFSESEMYKLMPPNEIDSVWFSNMEEGGDDLYFGHVYSIGIQRLRLLARLAGFEIHKIHHTKVNKTALILLLLTYPFVLLINFKAYKRAMRKRDDLPLAIRKDVFGKVFRLGVDLRVLLDGHLMVEFIKTSDAKLARQAVKGFHKLG